MLGGSEIQVLGTRFDVRRKTDGEVIVIVLEGTVRVRGYGSGAASSDWTRTLQANQKLAYLPIGLVEEPHETVALNAVKWRNGQVQFENTPLSEVVEELARYTDQKIYIRDPSIANLQIGGALSTQDIRKSLERLKEFGPVEIRENGGVITLESAQTRDSGNGTGTGPER
jgi:transmembrane sensor